MNRTLLSLTLTAALAACSLPAFAEPAAPVRIQAAATAASHAPDPARQVRELVRLFRASDVAGLAQALVPPSKWEEIQLVYELKQLEPVGDKERADFAEMLDRITASDAVDRLMIELEPKLAEARPQVPGATLMAFGAMAMAISSPESDLTDEQREALRRLMPGLQQWVGGTDFLDSNTLRQALTLVTDAARRVAVADLDELKALPFEAVLERAGTVFASTKQAVRLYGIDLDAVADSLQVEVLAVDGDTARVRTTVTLFNAPVFAEHELVLIEGRWYGKHAAESFHLRQAAKVEG
jgi:hypothetical protein